MERFTRNNHAFIRGNARFGSGKVMIYARISIDGPTNLHIIQIGALYGHRYGDKILRPIVVTLQQTEMTSR
ncbi:hypothetical protein TNCV_3309141 [Trichonephila clavipes]|nr:hypothetical protein TNCV_3309141 [Trichonephila clavipes]